jgi:hypothetical protein
MNLVTRAMWGGPVTINVPKLPIRQGMAVHYNGPVTNLAGMAHMACYDYWLATHRYHVNTNGWSAIGYAWGVCPHGYVFEGRGFDCDQAAQGDPGNETHQAVQFMLGGEERPTQAMLQAWYDLRADLRSRGVGAEIRPHSSFNSTSCPGDYLRGLINDGTLAKEAEPVPDWKTLPEPRHFYLKVRYDGHTINRRTRGMLNRAAKILGQSEGFDLSQGSYSNGSQSAGTHSGGGAVDVSSSLWSVAKALRQAGFAAWVRTPAEGQWPYHIHAIAIGDRRMSEAARRQVASYFAGRNALANNRADTAPDWVGRPYPDWTLKYR